jgi:hypothetical protein
MAEPGDQIAAGGHGRLRASHADREQVIGTLKAAFIQGRLTKAELDLRVGQALASRTYAELAALTADLPAGVTAAQPVRTPAPQRAQTPEKAAKVAAFVSLALALLLVTVFLGPGSVPERLIGLAVFFLPVCGLSLGGLLMLHSWLDKRSQGQLPRGPAPGMGGQVSQRPVSADPGRQLPPAGHGHQRTAEAARRRLPRPLPS